MRKPSWLAIIAVVTAPCGALAQPPESEGALGPTSSEEAQLPADDERARMHFDAGRSYYEEGAYDRARDEFEHAWELSRRPPLLLNLATVLERLGEHAQAAERLREYLRLEADPPHRELIERRIENLERLHAARSASEAAEPASARPPPNPVAPPPGPDGALVASGAISLALGGAAGIALGIVGGLALAADEALATGCGATTSCTEADVADARTLVLVSDVMIGVTAGAVAIGAVLIAVAFATAAPAESMSTAFVAPWIDAEGAGLVGVVRW